MAERIAYSQKYKGINKRWGLPTRQTNQIIRAAEGQLIDEILDDTPLRISNWFRDKRTDHEYYYDLIEGRIIEDLLVLWFKTKGFEAVRMGTDADNKIERSKGKKITTSPDLLVNNKLVEVQVSRQGRRHKYHIKDNKAKKVWSGESVLMFVVDDDYLVVLPETIDPADMEYNMLWGGKKCYCVRPSEQDYRPLTKDVNWL